jgi:lipoprotein-anchoring transpeptidase ErfK/SrfK
MHMKSLVTRAFLPMVVVISWTAASASDLTKDAVNQVQFEAGAEIPTGERTPRALALQLLLDRAHASPGVMDGYYGMNTEKALAAFAEMRELEWDGSLTAPIWDELRTEGDVPLLIEYTISEADVEGPFLETVPDRLDEMAELDHLSYTGPEELLAEKFHLEIELLHELNPDARFDEAGVTIVVPAVRDEPPDLALARIEVDKDVGQVRGYDDDERLVVAYPATVGSAENPSPSGTHEIEAVALEPVYYYRPDEDFQMQGIDQPLDIPEGPNNPVGTVWIDLSEPGYGIHGTPNPEQIDREHSLGCVRLTNWDAEELAAIVEAGTTKVVFVE